MRIAAVALLLLAAVPSFAAPPALNEAEAHPGEWGFRPLEGRTSETDPPAFVWRPQRKARTYDLRVEKDDATPGRDLVHEASGLTLHAHCPPATLGPGRFRWRFRFTDERGETSAWSRARSFSIEEGATVFPLPSRKNLLARIPAGHPRLFLRPEDLPRLKERVAADLAGPWQRLVRECERMLERPVDASEPLTYRAGEIRGVNDAAWRKRWWGNRERTLAVVDGAARLAFAWMVSGDERFGHEARRLLLAACSWDPKGATGYAYNDEAGMPFAWAAARTYTWLHGFLSEEDRARVREVMAIRGRDIHRHLAGRHHIWRPYGSHANRAWHWLGEVGIAFHGEVDGADDAVWFASNVFFAAYPVWSDDAGGWHEGLAYWSSYLGRVTTWLQVMKSALGIDGVRKPFFHRTGDFGLYVAPPGETLGGFGDQTMGFDSRRYRPLMTALARMTGNPHWQWLVDESGGTVLPGGYLGVLLAALPEVEGKPPASRPNSACFPGVGLASLHRDLLRRETDAQFLLKSSPMGAQSHGYEAQNAFLLSVVGEPIFIRSGKRDLYGSPHHRKWMWSTRSVNSVLVNGRGQARHSASATGKITRFATGEHFDWIVGEAGGAYGDDLDRFTRCVVFVRPDTLVVFDVLEAPEPSTYQWLLHAPREMSVDGRTIRAEGRVGAAVAEILSPSDLRITQTDRFDPPPQPWVKLRQWHLTAATTKPRAAARYVTVIRPYRKAAGPPVPGATLLESPDAIGVVATLSNGERAIVVFRTRGEGRLSLGGLETDGEVAAVVVGADGSVRRAFRP